MKKQITKKQSSNEQNQANIIQFSGISKAKNGSYMVRIGRNLLFLHPNLLKAVDAQAKKKAS